MTKEENRDYEGNSILRLEFNKDNEHCGVEFDETDDVIDFTAVEYEILPPVDTTDKRQIEIYKELEEVNDRLDIINQRVCELNTDIDRFTNQANWVDYTIAVACGILTGLVDVTWVQEFSMERGEAFSHEKINDFVIKTAQNRKISEEIQKTKVRYKREEKKLNKEIIEEIKKNIKNEFNYKEKGEKKKQEILKKAIQFLEKYGAPSDSVTSDFGGGLQHHLRDFAHHPNIFGLCFSILSQFTELAYGTDKKGDFISVKIKNKNFIGKTPKEKFLFGVVFWFLHLASDMAGSHMNPGEGTGIPGPILSILKELSSLPIFKNKEEVNEFRIFISKAFNGTLLADTDELGKIIKESVTKVDLREEFAAFTEMSRQSIPVLLNEAMVRGLYFIHYLIVEIKKNGNKLKGINTEKIRPYKNRTIRRMITISTGTFMTIDLADAGIRAVSENGFTPAAIGAFVLRVNFVGVGRFAIAITSDIKMGAKKSKSVSEKIWLNNENLLLINSKVYYKQANVWITAENTSGSITKAYEAMEASAIETIRTLYEIQVKEKQISEGIIALRKDDEAYGKELARKMRRRSLGNGREC